MKSEGQMRTLPPLTHPGGHRQPGDSDVMLFVVGGHLMLFVTRQAPSWQLVSALLCGIGSGFLGIPALPWAFVDFVWVYNLVWMVVWMVVMDVVKLGTYRFLDGYEARAADAGA